MIHKGLLLNNRYEIESLIGEGGMSQVFQAFDHVLDRFVAIKTVRFAPDLESSQEELYQRIHQEAHNAARLNDRNIVAVYDVSEYNGIPYIVMEFLEGKNLREIMVKEGVFTLEGTLAIIRQVARGLDYAHDQGIIHRDIKPENIMILFDDTVKITDFGISRAQATVSNLTRRGYFIGTYHYIAPEQLKEEPESPIDYHVDIYALGIVIFEMLAGIRPFEADTVFRLISKILVAPPPKIDTLRQDLPAGISAIIDRCLSKNREERYHSCKQLFDALEKAAAQAPPQAGDAAGQSAPPLPEAPLPDSNAARQMTKTPGMTKAMESSRTAPAPRFAADSPERFSPPTEEEFKDSLVADDDAMSYELGADEEEADLFAADSSALFPKDSDFSDDPGLTAPPVLPSEPPVEESNVASGYEPAAAGGVSKSGSSAGDELPSVKTAADDAAESDGNRDSTSSWDISGKAFDSSAGELPTSPPEDHLIVLDEEDAAPEPAAAAAAETPMGGASPIAGSSGTASTIGPANPSPPPAGQPVVLPDDHPFLIDEEDAASSPGGSVVDQAALKASLGQQVNRARPPESLPATPPPAPDEQPANADPMRMVDDTVKMSPDVVQEKLREAPIAPAKAPAPTAKSSTAESVISNLDAAKNEPLPLSVPSPEPSGTNSADSAADSAKPAPAPASPAIQLTAPPPEAPKSRASEAPQLAAAPPHKHHTSLWVSVILGIVVLAAIAFEAKLFYARRQHAASQLPPTTPVQSRATPSPVYAPPVISGQRTTEPQPRATPMPVLPQPTNASAKAAPTNAPLLAPVIPTVLLATVAPSPRPAATPQPTLPPAPSKTPQPVRQTESASAISGVSASLPEATSVPRPTLPPAPPKTPQPVRQTESTGAISGASASVPAATSPPKPTKSPDAWKTEYAAAQALVAAEEYDQAIAKLQQLKTNYPAIHEITTLLSQAQQGKHDQMLLTDVRKAMTRGDYDQAKNLLDQLKTAAPNHPAIPALERELESHAAVEQNLVVAKQQADDGNYKKALELLKPLKEQDPKNVKVHELMSWITKAPVLVLKPAPANFSSISATVTDDKLPVQVVLHYSVSSAPGFRETLLQKSSGNEYEVQLADRGFKDGVSITYYVTAQDAAQNETKSETKTQIVTDKDK